ncbi:MAG: OmpA family protein [Myxococcota bacterium]
MGRTMWIAALLITGCVGKKKHNALIEAAASTEAGLNAEVTNLKKALANAEATNASLGDLTETLEAKNAAQNDKLQALAEKVTNLSAVNRTQRGEKAELEDLMAKLREEAEEAEAEAQEARDRAATLAEEREELAAERERLAEEKAALEQRTAEYDALVEELKSEIEAGAVTITELSGKLTVNVSDRILFASGQTNLKPEGVAALTRVASILARVDDREIRVEGHTDNVPVRSGAPFPDNWALSSLRASHVVALLVKEGVDPLNIASVGYGEHRPAASNDDAASRALNRRIEIVLVPRLKEEAPPTAQASTP